MELSDESSKQKLDNIDYILNIIRQYIKNMSYSTLV